MFNVNLTDDQCQYIQGSLRQDVQNFFDDPTGWLGESHPTPDAVKAEIERLRTILTVFGLDFDAVVKEEATDYEVDRVRRMVQAT